MGKGGGETVSLKQMFQFAPGADEKAVSDSGEQYEALCAMARCLQQVSTQDTSLDE